MNLCQSCVLSQGMQRWHEGVSLLTPLTLQDLMRHPLVVVPHTRGIFAAEHPDGARSALLWKASKHGLS